jgi:hypothetical protein
MEKEVEKESLLAAYKVPGFRAQARMEVYDIKDHPALVITLERRITAFTTRDGIASPSGHT